MKNFQDLLYFRMLTEDDINAIIQENADAGSDARTITEHLIHSGVPKALAGQLVRLHPCFHDLKTASRDFRDALAALKDA